MQTEQSDPGMWERSGGGNTGGEKESISIDYLLSIRSNWLCLSEQHDDTLTVVSWK